MSDTKESTDRQSDEAAIKALEAASEPAETKDESAAEPVPSPAKSGSFKTKAILYLLALALIGAGGAWVVYPLWRDDAVALLRPTGLDLPAVPNNAYYRFVADLAGKSSPAPAAPAAVAPQPDPLAGLLARIDQVERKLALVDAATAKAERVAGDAAAKADAAERAVSALAEKAGAAAETDFSANLADLSARLDALTARIERGVASGTAGAAAPAQLPAANAAILESLGGLRERIAAVEQREAIRPEQLTESLKTLEAANRNARAQIAALETRLSEVQALAEKRAPQRQQAALLLIAVGQLEAAASGSGSFAGQLASVSGLKEAASAGTDVAAAFDTLSAHASTGAASLAVLRARFPDVAAAIARARLIGSEEGFVGQTLSKIAGLVSVRRTDMVEGSTVDAVLARAEKALGAGDLASAVAALSQLEGAPAGAAGLWLGDAKVRLAVDAAVARLKGAALKALAEAG